MRDVQEIIQLVSLRGGSELKSLGNKSDNTLYEQLFDGIKKGTFVNDEVAANELYGAGGNSKAKYKTLKSRLKDILLDNVILMKLDPRKQSSNNILIHNAVKNFCTARLLLLNQATLTGSNMMKKALQLSTKAETTGISLLCLQYLSIMSSIFGNGANFERYKNQIFNTIKLYEAELEAESIENNIRVTLYRQIGFSKKYIELMENSFKRLTELTNQNKSSNIRWNYFRVGYFYYISSGNYEKLLVIANEADIFNKSNKELYNVVRGGELSLYQLTSYLQLKQYRAGTECAEKCKIYFAKGSYNWFIYMENYFLFELNNRNYERALQIYNEAIRDPRMKNLPPDRQERWKIYEAYLYYMLPPVLRPTNFKVLKFLNEVPIYSKDKGGYNVAINIIQILLMIHERQFGRLIDKAESLKMYRSRYIKEDDDFRSNCFVKMLLIMIRCDFDPVTTKRDASTYFKKMESFGEKSGRHFDAMEVVPYEVLWGNVMEDIQFYKPHSA